MGEDPTRFHLPRRSSEGLRLHRPTRGSLKRTTSISGEPRQVQFERKLGSTDVDGKWQLDSPTAANDEKIQTVTGYKRRAPMAARKAAADAPNNLQAAVQHNADKEKEKPVEATCGPG